MDPLSALIGGGLNAGASIIGGMMNTSSAAAINTQNLQQQMALAQGRYLPDLVANAQKAGLSPLAVLGIHTPGFAGATPTDPGSGIAAGGRALGDAISQIGPHQNKMMELQERKGETEIQALNAQITNANIEMARNKYALDQLRAHPNWLAPGNSQPASETATLPANASWLESVLGPHPESFGGFGARFGKWLWGGAPSPSSYNQP